MTHDERINLAVDTLTAILQTGTVSERLQAAELILRMGGWLR